LLSGAGLFPLEFKISLTATPDQKIRRGNTVSEFEFPREMGNLFESKPKGNGFNRTKSFQHLAGLNQPLFVQPILWTASKIGMSVTT